MRYSSMIVIMFSMISQVVLSQSSNKSGIFKNSTFQCFGRIDSIKLPHDLMGPKYFNYEEGSIVSFASLDSSKITILCGADASLSLDSLYLGVDSVIANGRLISVKYINKTKDRYARQDYDSKYDILYQDVPYQRKGEFDATFDMLKDSKQMKR